MTHTHEVAPGQTCPSCNRKVPHPRKPSSPKSRVKAFRIPADIHHDYGELLEAAAHHAGIADRPFSDFNVINAGLVLVLQQPQGFLADAG